MFRPPGHLETSTMREPGEEKKCGDDKGNANGDGMLFQGVRGGRVDACTVQRRMLVGYEGDNFSRTSSSNGWVFVSLGLANSCVVW